MVADLRTRGALRTDCWQDIFAEVPRHLFLGRFLRAAHDEATWDLIDARHPDWLRLLHTDTAWTVQLDHDELAAANTVPGHRVTGQPTAWAPTLATSAVMMEALAPRDRSRVLCVGDATGYHAALLTHRLGPDTVVGVEPDGRRADHARRALAQAGYLSTVFVGDPTMGYRSTAPYDRILAAQPVDRIPPSWVVQVWPSGIIVATLRGPLVDDLLVRLTCGTNGTSRGNFWLPRPCVPQEVGLSDGNPHPRFRRPPPVSARPARPLYTRTS